MPQKKNIINISLWLLTLKGRDMDLKSTLKYTKNLSILYVEDDEDAIEHLSSILETLFLTVDKAFDGKHGLETYSEYYTKNHKYYDLVLTDIEMPNKNGIQLSEIIMDINPNQHIIVISAYNDKERLQQLLTLGITNFLHKPVESRNFFDTFKKCSKIICEQMDIKEELISSQENNHNLEVLFDIINQVAIISKSDLQGNITFVNDLFCLTSGYKEEELLGESHNILKHKDMPDTVFKNIWQDIKTGKVWRGKLKNQSKDNEDFYVNANIFPIMDSKNKIIEYISIQFITTEEEVKNREFKKKVIEQYQESKRTDFTSRKMIDDLQKELKRYKKIDLTQLNSTGNVDFLELSLKNEKLRSSKFNSQLKYTENNYKRLEDEFDKYKFALKEKLSTLVEDNKTLQLREEVHKKKLLLLEDNLESKELEFNKMNENNEKRSKEIGDLREVIIHLEEQKKTS